MSNIVEPKIIYAGDTISWKKSINNYKASEYNLVYYFRGLNGTFDVSATADGDNYKIDISSSTTSNYTAGFYDWEARVTKISGSDIKTIDCGAIEIKKSLSAQSSGYDPRSSNKKLLDAITSLLENNASKADVESFSIGGRSISKMSFAELLQLQNKLKWSVKFENCKNIHHR